VVLLELAQRLLEGTRHLRHVLQLLWRETVDVLVQRLARLDCGFRSRPVQPSAWPRKRGTGCRTDRGNELDALALGEGEYIGIRMAADRLREL